MTLTHEITKTYSTVALHKQISDTLEADFRLWRRLRGPDGLNVDLGK
jgi:hypothetical protein